MINNIYTLTVLVFLSILIAAMLVLVCPSEEPAVSIKSCEDTVTCPIPND